VKRLLCVGVCVVTLPWWSSVVYSEEQKGTVQLPPIEVQASPAAPERSQSENQARRELQRTPGGVALIGSPEIRETRATALHDVLDFVPGIMVRPRFGNVADESQISIRGSGLRNNFHLRGLTLLLDGFPLNNADGFGDFEAAELLSTKRLEVYKGANALRFGVNTLGGAINLVTRTGEDNRPLEIRSQGGSFGFMKHSIATGQVAGPFDLYVGLTHTSQDGYRDHSELTRRRAYASFGYRLTGGTMLRLDLNYVRSDQHLPGALTREEFKRNATQRNPNSVAAKEARDFDYYRSAFTASIPLSDTQTLDWFTQVNYQYLEHPLSFAVINQNTYNWGSELRYLLTAPLLGMKNRLTVGMQYHQTRQLEHWFQNVRGNHGAKARDQMNKATTIGLYAEEQLSPTDTLTLLLGARLQYVRRAIDDAFLSDGSSSGAIEYLDVSPKVGFVWQMFPTIQMYGNASRAYEPPLLLEITAPGQLNSNLRLLNPQKAWQFEIGTRNNWGERLWWDVSVYDIELWDEIQNVNIQPFPAAPFTIPRFRNIDRSRHTGVEVATDFRLIDNVSALLGQGNSGDSLRLRASYTWSHFVFVDDADFGNNNIPGAPEHFLRTELRYDHPHGLWFAPNLETIPTGYFVNSENTVRTNPYTLVNLRAGYTMKAWNLDLFFEARNMTDKDYVSGVIVDDANGRFIEPGDGRAFYGGVSYRW
jgi:iron complex outermembrane recepter protein